MAISYDHASTGIFTHIGKLIKRVNAEAATFTTVATNRDEIEDAFEAGDQSVAKQPLVDSAANYENAIAGWRAAVAELATRRLQDRVSVINELGISSNAIFDIISALQYQMVADGETVDASVVTVGSVTAASGNTGDGTILVSNILDGITPPGAGLRTHEVLMGVATELCKDDTIVLTVIRDSYTQRVTSGQESFSCRGNLALPKWGEPEGGSGTGPGIDTVNKSRIISNGDMETFSGETPGSWTVDSGTVGTHVRPATAAGTFYRGSSGIRFVFDGTQATAQISQAIGAGRMVPGKQYVVTVRYKASATDSASEAFTVQFEGTGYTAASSEKVNVAGNAWDTSWTLKHFFINVPWDIPSDWELVVKVTGTPTNGRVVYIDDVCVAPVTWHNGVGIVAVAGATPFVNGDSFSFTLSNDDAGVINRFFCRQYGVQLPSVTDASETIADTLAT